jgi:hypothetical protein
LKSIGFKAEDLRHCAGSLMLANGEDIEAVRELLGHSSRSVTEQIYAHALRAQKRKPAKASATYCGGRNHEPNFPQHFPHARTCAASATRIQRIPMLVERRGLEPRTLCLQSRIEGVHNCSSASITASQCILSFRRHVPLSTSVCTFGYMIGYME